MPSYLSAFDHFNSGQTDQGVQDLEDAYAKRSFEDYRTGLFQNLETMYREAGYSAADASTIALATPIPYLSPPSQLSRQISDLAGAYRQGGDEQSAQASLQIGLDLGERLAQAPDFPIANLAGIRLQERLLQGIDPDRFFSSALSAPILKRVGTLIRAFGRSRRAGRVGFSAPDAPLVGRLACGHSCWRLARLRQSRRREAIHYS